MSTRVAERVDDWEERPFSDGYRGLQDLAGANFSGVVRAGGADLYMTKGTVVGIGGGAIEDFEEANGTAHRAPSPALPLLAVMQDRSDEVRAKYYTEDTPMAEVDETLSEGGFTGYVELSENVLSGDYYLVYHQGRSMSVAFVGNSQQLVDGEEAFETANDEVGIYEVRPVEVEAIEVPKPEPEENTMSGAEPAPGPDSDAATAEPTTSDAAGATGEGAGEDGGPAARRQDEGGAEDADSEPPASGSGGADGTAEPADGTPDPGRAGENRADQPGADAADRRGEAAAEPSPETAETPRRDAAAEVTTEQEATDRTGEGTDPEGKRETESAGAGPGRPPQQEPGPERDHDEPSTDHGPPDESREETAESADDGSGSAGARSTREDESRRSEPTPQSDNGPTGERSPEETEPSPDSESETGRVEETGGKTGVALETRSVPSLDPGRTSAGESRHGDAPAGPQSGTTRQTAAAGGSSASQSPPSTPRTEPRAGGEPERGQQRARDRDPGHSSGPEPDAAGAGVGGGDPNSTEEGSGSTAGPETAQGPATASEDAADLRGRLEEREAELDRLEAELAEETERREQLETQLADVREERDELAAEVERLEAELERVEEEFGVAADASRRLTAAEALEGTDLFVRYRSKSGATLADAQDGEGRREDVTENLRLEQHTQFDADEVAVDGQDYGAFIRDRVEYQFVAWLVEDLLFEVRDAGGADGLVDLYDALPDIDRAELNGTVAVRYTEEGTEQRGQETFDIVLRDRMGNPLFVANLNDSRQGASEGMMEGLITAAERVGGSKDTLAGAFLVTESFFEPEALETAAEATKDGLLSRDKRKSFVNISRKRGYHLCLVEARNQNFHLAVPEL